MKLVSVPAGRAARVAFGALLCALSLMLLTASRANALAFVSEWGSEGAAQGEFETPQGIAAGSAGVYVADSGNDRVQQFATTGDFIRKWGQFGEGDGEFSYPGAVALDFAGNVYVADTNNNRIQKFDSTGNFLLEWGGGGTTNGRFRSPTGIAVDQAGNVYVADSGNLRVQKFDAGGAYITQWSGSGTAGEFGTIAGLDVDLSGNVYVADSSKNRIQKFDSNGAFLVSWGTPGTSPGQFNQPYDVAVDTTGAVHVTDMSNHRIQTFTSTGGFVETTGSQGSALGQFRYPTGIAVGGSDAVFVTDTLNHRVQTSDPGTSITVVKDSVPDDPQDFDFTAGGGLSPSSFQLDDDATVGTGLSNRRTFAVSPGSGYSLAETVPAGWDQASATCSDGSPVTNIDVSSQERVICTFTNRKRGRIVIVQDSQPDDPQDFPFTTGGGLSPSSFTLDDDGNAGNGLSNTQSLEDVVPGSGYSVAQSTPAGWGPADVTCSDGSPASNIDVGPGETVTCTFTNLSDAAGRINVVKDAQPDDPQDFSFTAGGGLSPSSFQLDDDGNNANALSNARQFVVAAGSGYSVAESATAGWVSSPTTCSDGSPASTIDVSSGETVTCTFTNRKEGQIVVIKDSLPDDPQDFSFTAGGGLIPSSFQLDDDGDNGNALPNARTFSGLVPGSGYSLSEAPAAGWDGSSSCSDGSPVSNIDVAPGETVVCTFTNRKHGKITVIKDAQPDDPQDFSFTAAGGLSPTSFTLDDDGNAGNGVSNVQVFDDISPQSGYSVAESTPPEWALTSTCSDGSSASNIAVAPGEAVTCTFTNKRRGSLTVVLDAQPDDPQDFSFSAGGGLSPTSFTLDDDGNSGNGVSNTRVFTGVAPKSGYSVTPSPVPGWLVENATCSDGSSPSNIDVAPSEDVTCTFVVSQKGRITVVKDAQPNSSQPFDFTAGGGLSPSSFQLDDDGNNGNALSNTRSFVADPGSGYSVTENVPQFWRLKSSTCSDGSVPSNIGLSAGETVTCTFVNDQDRYPHPRGASPLSVALVPAYKQCTAPNRTHGSPLAFPSCNPPVQASSFLTNGSPDANGAGANASGSVVLKVHDGQPGPPNDADVKVTSSMLDVRCQASTSASVCNVANSADGPDYSGRVLVTLPVRITDGSGGVPATVVDIPFPVTLTCAGSPPTTTGGTCVSTTTLNSIMPNAVQEGERAVWQVDGVQVMDGGQDGDVTTADNTLYLTQGVFVP